MAGSHGRELWFDTDLGDEFISTGRNKTIDSGGDIYAGYTILGIIGV